MDRGRGRRLGAALAASLVGVASLVGLGATAGPTSSALAATQLTPEPRRLMTFAMADLEALARDQGWLAERYTDPQGIEVLLIAVSGRRLALWPRACDEMGRCGGLYAFAVLPVGASSIVTNAFNARFPPARATVREGRVILDRYVVGDFGVARGSLAIDLQLLARLIDDFHAFHAGNGATWNAGFDPLLPLTVAAPADRRGHRAEIILPPAVIRTLTTPVMAQR